MRLSLHQPAVLLACKFRITYVERCNVLKFCSQRFFILKLEMRSVEVERGICPIATSIMNELFHLV